MVVVVGLIIGGIVLAASMCGGGPPSEETMEDRRKGFHCLSPWDGNHDGMEALVRAQLNDPGSMETHTTRITPVVGDTNLHTIYVEFSARNAFGGMVRSTATGWVDHDTCEAILGAID